MQKLIEEVFTNNNVKFVLIYVFLDLKDSFD